MNWTHDDIAALQKILDERYDARYVKITKCDTIQAGINRKFANDDKRIELLIHQQKINNWLTGAIATGIITLLIKVFLGG